MIHVSISAADLAVLQDERYTHPHPRVQRKLHALYFVGLGYLIPHDSPDMENTVTSAWAPSQEIPVAPKILTWPNKPCG